MRYSFLIVPVIILLASCSNEEQSEQTPKKETEVSVPAKGPVPIRNGQEAPKDNFQYDPVKVVEAVFEAARTRDYSVLSTLCDPMGENDAPTANLCNVVNATEFRENQFVEYFSTGKVVGEAKIEGNTASVPIKFGPKGDMNEVFVLVLRNGLWYLGQI